MPAPAALGAPPVPRRLELGHGPAPRALLGALARDAHPALLTGEWLALAPGCAPEPLTILASEPLLVAGPRENPFRLLARPPWATEPNPDLPGRAGGRRRPAPAAGSPGRPARVGGGWIGWLGYGLAELAEPGVLGPPPPGPGAPARFWLGFYDHLLIHQAGVWAFEMLETPGRAELLGERVTAWRQRLADAETEPKPGVEPEPGPGDGAGPCLAPAGAGVAGHLVAVADCRERIAAGELYQANLCLQLAGRWEGSPLELFSRGWERARPRFGAVVGGVVSFSPERFLRRCGRQVWTEPIKGTRPRPEDPVLAARAGGDPATGAMNGPGQPGPAGARTRAEDPGAAELAAAPKDRAEHTMIVDLMRNDLGRVCAYGTVAVSAPRVEPHAGVWQLVSTVSGRLRAEVDDGALLAATFPPGSVTGAPKIAAMAAISELEGSRRDAYTGAIGILSPIAGLDLNVAIRTFEVAAATVRLGVGGGIVADSDPEAELAEALTKAAGPLAAVSGRLAAPAAPERSRPPGVTLPGPRFAPPAPFALAHGRRPDPAAGVFETVLVRDGQAVRAADHLRRLRASVDCLYGHRLAGDLPARLARAAAGLRWARLRVWADPDAVVRIEAVPEAPPAVTAPVELMPWCLPGGLGAHKWSDRRLLAALAGAAPGTVPLLVDSDGAVLEAAWANVWILEDGCWITPPADGRLLPGVTRAARLADAALSSCAEPVDLKRLSAAEAISLSSSISGCRDARLSRNRG